jgi:hypothetical protein
MEIIRLSTIPPVRKAGCGSLDIKDTAGHDCAAPVRRWRVGETVGVQGILEPRVGQLPGERSAGFVI